MSFSFGGTTGFPAATSAPSFGFGTSTPATKAGFGTPGFAFGGAVASTPFNLGGGTTSTSSGFGFGGLSSASAPSSTGFAGFGKGFGSTPATGTTTTMSGATGFGGFGGFGSPATSATGATGFGAPAATGSSLFSGFGQPAATTTSTGFAGFGGFGATAGSAGGFGGFGTGLGGSGSTFGAQAQQQTQAQAQAQASGGATEALYNAVFNCNVYGDERDTTLARWNLLQAMWGTGKGYYSQTAPPVEFTQQNPLCRFKAIGYSCIPCTENKEGLVSITVNQKEADVKSNQDGLVNSLNSVLGNKPNLVVTVDSVKSMSETKTQVIIYVQEKSVTGALKRIPATDLAAYLHRTLCQTAGVAPDQVVALVTPDKDQLTEYLESPPAGIDPRLWKQAQLDNPDPEKYIPVPMVGFEEVRWRMKCQEQETKLHQAFLDRVAEDISELQRQHTATVAKISEYRHKFVELEHRVLQVLVRQEVSRKVGLALSPEEEVLRSQLESLQTQLNAPTQFKGRLGELLSQVRMQRQEAGQRDVERYTMDPAVQDDIKQFLLMEQSGMTHLIETIQSDLKDLHVIQEGMMRLLQSRTS